MADMRPDDDDEHDRVFVNVAVTDYDLVSLVTVNLFEISLL